MFTKGIAYPQPRSAHIVLFVYIHTFTQLTDSPITLEDSFSTVNNSQTAFRKTV